MTRKDLEQSYEAAKAFIASCEAAFHGAWWESLNCPCGAKIYQHAVDSPCGRSVIDAYAAWKQRMDSVTGDAVAAYCNEVYQEFLAYDGQRLWGTTVEDQRRFQKEIDYIERMVKADRPDRGDITQHHLEEGRNGDL